MGGSRYREEGGQPIRREDIPAVVSQVSELSGIPAQDFIPLGGTLKEPVSNDIDLGVDLNRHSSDVVHNRMLMALGEERCHFNPALGIYLYAIPSEHGLVQVDLMYSEFPEWLKFAYFADSRSLGRTQYKGVVRTILLISAAKFIHQDGIDHKIYEPNGDLLLNIGRKFDLLKGLTRHYQFRPLRKRRTSKDPSPYVKNMEKFNTLWELRMQCGFALPELHQGEITITDPNEALKMIFPGTDVSQEHVQSAEQVLTLIDKHPAKDRIVAHAKGKFDRFEGKIQVPF
jgi:hypothetical protein